MIQIKKNLFLKRKLLKLSHFIKAMKIIKIKYLHKLIYYEYNLKLSSENKNCILNEDFDKRIYEELNLKSLNEGELGIINLLDNITLMKFQDIVECKEYIFVAECSLLLERLIDDVIIKLSFVISGNTSKQL